MLERLTAYMVRRLEQEARSLTNADLEHFVREQMEQQGNWHVTEVKLLELSPADKTIKLQTKAPGQQGDDMRIPDGRENRQGQQVPGQGDSPRRNLPSAGRTRPHSCSAASLSGAPSCPARSSPRSVAMSCPAWGRRSSCS